MKTKKVSAPLPVYLFGLTVLVYSFIFPFYRLRDYLSAAALAAGVYWLSTRLLPGRTELVFNRTGVPEADALLAAARGNLDQLHQRAERLGHTALAGHIRSLADMAGKIFAYVSQHPESARQTRAFVEYYVPTLLKLLDTYGDLENIPGESARETAQKIQAALPQFAEAFQKQLDVLYEARALDIETDISVLQGELTREGLL
jgi:hypothetical protein